MPPPPNDYRRAGHVAASSSAVDLAAASLDTAFRASEPQSLTPRDRVPPLTSRPTLSQLPVSLLHRHSKSMNSVPTTTRMSGGPEEAETVTPGLGSRATKFLSAIRRSSSYKRTGRDASGMFSTPEERSASSSPSPFTSRRRQSHPRHRTARSPSPFRSHDLAAQPPSIAQIAIGLHTSRTPHLGPTHSHSRRLTSEPGTPRRAPPTASSSSSRAALPLRPSLKKASLSPSSTPSPLHGSRSTSPSISTRASSVPATPRSALSRISLAFSNNSSKIRLERFLGLGTGAKSASDSMLGLGDGSSDGELEVPRKSVRFTSIVEDDLERKVVQAPHP